MNQCNAEISFNKFAYGKSEKGGGLYLQGVGAFGYFFFFLERDREREREKERERERERKNSLSFPFLFSSRTHNNQKFSRRHPRLRLREQRRLLRRRRLPRLLDGKPCRLDLQGEQGQVIWRRPLRLARLWGRRRVQVHREQGRARGRAVQDRVEGGQRGQQGRR